MTPADRTTMASIGNIDGVTITDGGTTAVTISPVNLINNDFAFNTIGLVLEQHG